MDYETIRSKRKRDPSNPLFPINHLHSLYRHFFSSQKRKILSFDNIFGIRKLPTQIDLDEREVNFVNRFYPYSRQVIAA